MRGHKHRSAFPQRMMINQQAYRKFFPQTALLIVALMLSNVRAVAQPTEAQLKAAEAIYPAPGAQWRVMEQSFWQAHRVLKLVTSEWHHRPTVAVDESGKGYLLTYNIVHMSRATVLEHFSQIARKENLTITPDTARAYAEFFANAFFGSRDFVRPLSIEVAQEESPVDARRFRVLVGVLHEPSSKIIQYTLFLDEDGTISFEQ